MYHVQTVETIHTPDESHGRSDMGLVKGLAPGGVNIQELTAGSNCDFGVESK